MPRSTSGTATGKAATRCTRQGAEDQNYLRGVQAAGDDGMVHVHQHLPRLLLGALAAHPLRGLPVVAAASDAGNRIATSQVALPQDICEEVYGQTGYEQSVSNLQQVSLTSDGVFGDDGGAHQLGTISGSVADGLTVELAVPVNA